MRRERYPPVDLRHRRHWIFDLDGTLTVAMHDFEGLRARLGLPPGVPILEACVAHPESERLLAEVARWEASLAEHASVPEDVLPLLEWLSGRAEMGVLTRNTAATAQRTLEVTGLSRYFDVQVVLGRDQAAPKPSPDGIHKHLARWGADVTDAVMVGDHLFDLQAGRAAGTATVWVDRAGRGASHPCADRCVGGLVELLGDGSLPE